MGCITDCAAFDSLCGGDFARLVSAEVWITWAHLGSSVLKVRPAVQVQHLRTCLIKGFAWSLFRCLLWIGIPLVFVSPVHVSGSSTGAVRAPDIS